MFLGLKHLKFNEESKCIFNWIKLVTCDLYINPADQHITIIGLNPWPPLSSSILFDLDHLNSCKNENCDIFKSISSSDETYYQDYKSILIPDEFKDEKELKNLFDNMKNQELQ